MNYDFHRSGVQHLREKLKRWNVQLDYLAREDPLLKPNYRGALPCDALPSNASCKKSAYIVNTDEKGQPGKRWIALWMQDKVFEVRTVMDYHSSFTEPNC